MKLSIFLIINSVVAVAFGIAFVLLPATLLSFYGVTLGEVGLVIAQLYGSAILGVGLTTWFARNAGPSDAREGILLALFIADGAGFVLSLMGQLAGRVNALGWSTVGLYLLLALGFGYFRFFKQEAS